MSHMLLATAAVLAFADAFAWGPGHDTTVRCILEKMPAEWRERFKPEWMKDGYVKPAYPAPLGEMLSCSLAWTGPGGEKEWRYRRAPNGHAGWYWHGSPWRFDAAKLPPEARAIIEFRAPGRTFTTGIAVPGAVYIPFNAIFPYCLTDETPSFEPFRLSLDSAGETVMRRILDGACKDRKGLRR